MVTILLLVTIKMEFEYLHLLMVMLAMVMMVVGASSCHDSLIFMSTHKAMAARCLSRHQATYGLPPSM